MARSSTTYPRKWNSTKTTVIRIPEKISEDLLEIARRMDATRGFKMRDEHGALVLEFLQPKKVSYASKEPINVSSIPQRSPFRYPGGKTWFVPYIRDWLQKKEPLATRLIEPFAGGAIVSLTAAFERLVKHVIFAELDENVASVWRIVLNGQAEWLAKQIMTFDLSLENVRQVLDHAAPGLREKAFKTILRNRVQRGGIMASGAGLVKTGENGKGLNSRWYPETLARRIREINQLKDRLTFVEGDGFELIEEHQSDEDSVFYIDPPYTLAARRLYTKWRIDHSRLFSLMRDCKGDFLMSYDYTAEVVDLAKKYDFDVRPIPMKNTHHAKMTELLIGKDLSWISDQI